jgi:16S rRNA (adenine1518-N6/adenine1519-N6)-dimethyltransferase
MPGERERLEAHGVRPRKRLGQSFLVDPKISGLIVARAGWPAGAPIYEIGPGGGALTGPLLDAGHPVLAVEKDPVLCELLRERFAAPWAEGRLALVEGDALENTPQTLLRGEARSWGRAHLPAASRRRAAGPSAARCRSSFWMAGNLPYPITTALLLLALSGRDLLDGAVLMVQQEYGDRLLAEPGTRTYGSITVWTRAHARVRKLLRVGRSAFWPRPGVESVVLELVFPDPPPYRGSRPDLERVLRAAFGQRRKTLRNALAHGLGRGRDEVEAAIRAAGADPGDRAESLGLDRFARLTASLFPPDTG